MIVKKGDRFVVKSEDGKKMLGSYRNHEAAVKRLQQIEYFKHAKQTHDFEGTGDPMTVKTVSKPPTK